ncbi:MAG: 4Fe-4S binding protein [Spirochaetaceae bacterium]|nr:4Fe-4S binding protein [Spirochaetaceae bacterium]
MKLDSFADFNREVQKLKLKKQTEKTIITVSRDSTCCLLKGSMDLSVALEKELENHKLTDKVLINYSGCLGFCEIEPVVLIEPQNLFFQNVTAQSVQKIVSEILVDGKIPHGSQTIEKRNEGPFYKKQLRFLTGQNEKIEPGSIDDYLVVGGYSALVKVLETMEPRDVINEIKESGLRGRGGGGFPTGKKWESCRNASAPDGCRYVICNGDEGDPGAYMDRSLMESNPHSILEGMIIGSYAIGANEGYIFVRAEYPLAVEHMKSAILQAENYGFLGSSILGSDHNFTIHITMGAGAFVCGESTALMASLEGKAGFPRVKHIHTVEQGFRNKPSNLNNVETWANVPYIISRGAQWYKQIGTAGSRGTKIFSLVGKVKNTGLIEVPMGITLGEIIFEIGGGIPENKNFKAVQTGGPSGGCLPEGYLDSPVDFDALINLGSMMGSGGMIVMDEDTCMVEIARFYLNFLVEESCGKCTPCREGLWQLLSILTRISHGEGNMDDLTTLEELGEMIKDSSLCALGKTAPNPVLSTLRYFREEYIEHIRDRKCRAGVCRDLFRYTIDKEKCTGCSVCRQKCPYKAISGEKKEHHSIDTEICVKCGICFEVCKFNAVRKVS